MNYGISGLSIIPVRREPSEKSEMVTQVLFGEHFEIQEQMVGWSLVKLEWDDYVGWIDNKMITPVHARNVQKLAKKAYAITGDIISFIPVTKEQNIMVVAGSTLPVWRPYLKEFSINGNVWKNSGEVLYGKHKDPRTVIIKQALKYFNAPYLWGGRSPFGIDCSGLTQILYKMIGIRLPRDASEQVKMGTPLGFMDETEPGDLAFFDDEEGRIIHVGILWKRNKIIHASGKVRIDNIDQFGIFNIDSKRYTHKLRVIKQIINADGKN